MTWSQDTPITAKPAENGPHAQACAQGWAAWHDGLHGGDNGIGPIEKALLEATSRSGVRSLLSAVFGCSPYLTQSLLREPWILAAILHDGFDVTATDLLARTHDLQDNGLEDRPRQLRHLKRRIALVAALADLAGAWDLMQVTSCLSRFADLAIQVALVDGLEKLVGQGRLHAPKRGTLLRNSGVFILGMGKLGASELNYSSDIDLIILYDPARLPVAGDHDARAVTTRLAQYLVQALDQRTGDGYVFRTDLRLRPDPGSTPLAIAIDFAETYYQSTALSWERAAMLKARVVAGDRTAAIPFMKAIQRWVWRGKMDFSALADIGSVKQRINQHHLNKPQNLSGFDVKLGLGGIREIEFFAQAQQLIYGAHHDRLRRPRTLDALQALAGAGHLSPRRADNLATAYRFWRTLEHRLQMVDDQQTHQLPEDPAEQARIAAFMGLDFDDLQQTIGYHQHSVSTAFIGLFGQMETVPVAETGSVFTVEGMGFADPARARRLIEGWIKGTPRATRNDRARALLVSLLPDLLGALTRHGQPDQALLLFDRFVESLSAGVTMFSLLKARPDLCDLLGLILSTSPALAEMIGRQPLVLEAVLAPDFFAPLPNRTALDKSLETRLRLAENYEDALDLCRRWVHERQFQAGVQCLSGHADANQGGHFLTNLAEAALAALLPRVITEFSRRYGEIPGTDQHSGIALVAMGNLATGDLTITSDIDLILIYQNPPDATASTGPKALGPNEYWLKLAERLVSAITAPTAAGRLYDLDLRLRPMGDSGPLAISLEAFIRYQREQAWTWEHMALTRARPIIGPPGLCADIAKAMRHTLTRPRDPEKLRHDVVDMRQRIDQQFGRHQPWRLKYRRGGLVDTQFVAQYLQLRHAHSFDRVLSPDTEQVFANLAAIDALPAADAATLAQAHNMARQLQFFIRLFTSRDQPFDPDNSPVAVLNHLAKIAGYQGTIKTAIDFLAAGHHVTDVLEQAHHLYQHITGSPS